MVMRPKHPLIKMLLKTNMIRFLTFQLAGGRPTERFCLKIVDCGLVTANCQLKRVGM